MKADQLCTSNLMLRSTLIYSARRCKRLNLIEQDAQLGFRIRVLGQSVYLQRKCNRTVPQVDLHEATVADHAALNVVDVYRTNGLIHSRANGLGSSW